MEASAHNENSSTGTDHDQEHVLNHGGTDSNPEIAQEEKEEEEVRGIYWKFLSFIVLLRAHHLPFKESVRRYYVVALCRDLKMGQPLMCPFQPSHFQLSLNHILLAARSIYPNLSKLALALEKNLLVTSTLTICTKPYPQMMPNPEPEKASDEAQPQSNSIQNGVEPMMGDRDEIMTEVEEADIDDMTIDMDAFQEMVGSSEANSTAVENS